jgi:hypothetical protein
MNEMNNIPGVNESWQQAEQMLDRHFRRRRVLVFLLAILIPAVVGLTAFFALNKSNSKDNNVSENLSVVNTSVQTQSQSQTANSNNSKAVVSSQDRVENSHSNNTRSLTSTQINSQASLENNKRSSNKKLNTPVTGVLASAAVVNSSELTAVPVSEKEATPNSFEQLNIHTASEQPGRSEVYAMNRINYMIPGSTYNSIDVPELRTITPHDYYHTGISWMVSAYGGPFYVSKTLSTTNDWNSYIDQRNREEENIVVPSFGLSVAATLKKFTFSLGAEYATYGEKVNYSPYSLQNTYVENGDWVLYFTPVQQTDTAFVTGNQYFISTTVMRQDSTFNSDIDTIQEMKYDQNIADHNGMTRITYVEVPVMVSYNVVSGRAGVGISAGISPGWLTSTSGYYLSTDSKGFQSLEEIEAFRKFMLNGRVGVDFYYRMSSRMCLNVRPQLRTNLNSVFEESYGVKQKYTSTGILFGISWLLK